MKINQVPFHKKLTENQFSSTQIQSLQLKLLALDTPTMGFHQNLFRKFRVDIHLSNVEWVQFLWIDIMC